MLTGYILLIQVRGASKLANAGVTLIEAVGTISPPDLQTVTDVNNFTNHDIGVLVNGSTLFSGNRCI